MTENMKNLDEEIAQQIKNDHIKKMVFTARNYSLEDVETIVCGNLNTIAYEYEKALTAQRQSWEREKEELIAESKRAEKEWGYKSEDHYIDKCRRQEAESRIRILEAEKQALEAEKKGLEERVWEYKNEWESALYREQGLKAENETLGSENAGFEGLVKALEEKIDRLTSALVAAHEALKGIMYKRIKDNDALEFAEYVLADKEGTLAFEKWKKIVEAVEQFVQCGECSTCSCCLDIGKEALESLDAKGERE